MAGNWKFAWNIWDEHCNVSTATANLKQIRIAGKASQSRIQSPACLTGQNNCCHQPKRHARDFTSPANDGFQCVASSSGRLPRLPQCQDALTHSASVDHEDSAVMHSGAFPAGPRNTLQTLVLPRDQTRVHSYYSCRFLVQSTLSPNNLCDLQGVVFGRPGTRQGRYWPRALPPAHTKFVSSIFPGEAHSLPGRHYSALRYPICGTQFAGLSPSPLTTLTPRFRIWLSAWLLWNPL